MNVRKATAHFEEWLARYTLLVSADLDTKHEQMRAALFPFLRATFYRWAQLWPETCAELCDAPRVLSVGDLHVENFGTWRDADGRLVWGVNDFDEACHLPYPADLVRLAVSASLAVEAGNLALTAEAAAGAALAGYTEGLHAGGRPFVLAERHGWLREVASASLKDPEHFWAHLDKLPDETGAVPESALSALEHLLPAPGLNYTIKHRVAGLGSLGKPRFVAITQHAGGRAAREAKALTPSAALWAKEFEGVPDIFYQAVLDRAVRCPDPFVQLQGHWIVRRLAPDCTRVELARLGDAAVETKLLHAMGWETANIHLGTRGARELIDADLRRRKPGWLHIAAQAMLRATRDDWEEWKSA